MNCCSKRVTILVTGGAGYIGSHCVLTLLSQNYDVVVVDNCSNTYMEKVVVGADNVKTVMPESLKRVEELAGKGLAAFYKLDLVEDDLDVIFRGHNIDAVIHFAALKSVSESIRRPLAYYTNNVIGTMKLLDTMQKYECYNLIFSSSATVYGQAQYLPVDEKHTTGVDLLNPYGKTKFMIEQILLDLCSVPHVEERDKRWNITSLRYFNPIGAHPSGYIGECTRDIPNNLMPHILQVVAGKRKKLYVYGNDFDTIDGTGVRDYVHVMDIAEGHIKALDSMIKETNNQKKLRFETFNLGTGKGLSVLELIRVFEETNETTVPFEIVGRRLGDTDEVYADVELARRRLSWCAKRSVADMVRDSYKWQILYPNGYDGSSPRQI